MKPVSKDKDMEFTRSKWREAYRKSEEVSYDPNNVSLSIQASRFYIKRYMNPSAKLFLEAGCGTARSSLDISLNHRGLTVVCLDIALDALLIARRLFEENHVSAFFICGDMRYLPFKDGVFDFIFSDGAVEHVKETNKTIGEFFRVLRKGGRVLLTVPQVSISMLTVGQFRGNIPNLPPLRQIMEFIQVRLLGGRFMKNGYELSFTFSQLRCLLNNFSSVEVGLYETFHKLEWLRIETLKNLIWALMRHKLFCPLIYGFGIKNR